MIKRNYFHILFLGLCLISFNVLSQDDEDPVLDFDPKKINMPLLSLRLDGGIPNPVSSQLFRKKFIGVYQCSGSLNIKLSKLITFGIGYENALFSVSNRLKFGVKTKMQTHTGFGRLSFNHFHRNSVFSTLFLSGGYSSSIFTDVVCLNEKIPVKNHSFAFLQPGYSLNFFAEENMTLGFFASYTLTNFVFNPYSICLEDWTPVDNLNSSARMSYFSIGLEMYWGLKRRK